MGSLFMGRETSREVFARIVELPKSRSMNAFLPLVSLAVVSLAIVGWYLATVPWEKTGLHAVLYHPETAKLAREYSLKLLTNKYLKYAVSIFNSSLAPLLACLLAAGALHHWGKRKFPFAGLYVAAILPILAAVSLSGARGPTAMILLTVVFFLFLLKGLPLQPLRIAVAAALILVIPGMMEFLRAGGAFSPTEMWARYALIWERAAGYGMTVDAQWHVEYATRFGFWGIAGVEKLAPLFGVTPVDIMNIVGRHYTDTTVSGHISANASLIFLYWACFSWAALPLCLLLAWLLDAALFLYRRMETIMLSAAVAVAGIAAVNLAHTAYTTIFITHGFLIILSLCFLMDRGLARLPAAREVS